MNMQAKQLTNAVLSTIASLLLSVKNTVIEYQTKLFPFARAFFGFCLSGNSGRLLLIAAACLAIGGCSTALITVGVLDRPEQEGMFSAVNRHGLEALAGKPIASRTNVDGKVVDLYSFVDGEAGRRPMRGNRAGFAFATLMTAGFFEPLMVPSALYERSLRTRTFYVVYAPDNRILAICYPGYLVILPDREESLCDSEPAPEVTKTTIKNKVAE
jgi:hypothetical protein